MAKLAVHGKVLRRGETGSSVQYSGCLERTGHRSWKAERSVANGVEIQETDNGGRNNTQTGWHRELSEAEWLDSTAQRILDAGCEIEESRMTPQFFLNSYLYDLQ